MIDATLLGLLVCPACKGKVEARNASIVCTQSACGLEFPIQDGIPVMLIDEARKRV